MIGNKQSGFTLFDIMAVLFLGTALFAITIPSIQASREAARRMACADNLKTLGTALRQYHDTHQVLPSHRFGPGADDRFSALTMLLPYLGHEAVLLEIRKSKNQVPWRMEKIDSRGNVVRDRSRKAIPGPYCTVISKFLCPADSEGLTNDPHWLGQSNYVVSHGDWIVGEKEEFSRGVFVPQKWLKFSDVSDGLSSTVAMSERCIGPKIRTETVQGMIYRDYPGATEESAKQDIAGCWNSAPNGKYTDEDILKKLNNTIAGHRWADGQHSFVTFSTILPPNGPTCLQTNDDRKPIIAPPTSYHFTGVSTLMLDGSVSFTSNKIDNGDSLDGKTCVQEGISPFGIWGRLGNRNDGQTEKID